MGKRDKQDESWDDSALINAFNDAISKYMKMHVQESQTCPADEGKVISSKGENVSALVDQANDVERIAETNDESTISSNVPAEIEETGNLSTVTETTYLKSEAPENHIGSSAGQYSHHEYGGYPYAQSTEDYNQLVNKYYELEDERQKILQQLNEFGYWNHNSTETTVTSQEPQSSTSQAHPTVLSSFCPYGCQSWVAPCTSLPCYCFSGAYVSNNAPAAPAEAASTRNTISTGVSDFVRAGLDTAERALSSLKEQAYTKASISENEGKVKQLEEGNVEKSTCSETDLTVVLNAWYSAGFYTGKYLSQQSCARRG